MGFKEWQAQNNNMSTGEGTGFAAWSKENEQSRGFFGKIGESIRRGSQQAVSDVAFYNAMAHGKGDLAKVTKARQALKRKDQTDPIDGNFIADMFYGGARVAGQMYHSVKAGGKGAAVVAGIGGAGGAVAGAILPTIGEEPATILGGAIGGLKVGAKLGLAEGAALFSYKQGAGMMLGTMLDAGYDPKKSLLISQIAAIPYALIEVAQIKGVTPGLRKGLDKTIQKSVAKILRESGKRYAKTLATETFEEVGQEYVNIIAEDVAAEWSGKGIKKEDVKQAILDRWKRLGATAIESAKSFALIPAPGAAIDVAVHMKPDQAKTIKPNQITDSPTKIIQEETHDWTEEEINNTFGEGLYEALQRIKDGDMEIDELVELSELRNVPSTIIQGLPSLIEGQALTVEEVQDRISDLATEMMEQGVPQENAWNWAKKQIEDDIVELGAERTAVQEAFEVHPELGSIEFMHRERKLAPKTTVVTEIAKLMSSGLNLNQAISTLESLRAEKQDEVTHKEQIDAEVDEIVENLRQQHNDILKDDIIGNRQSKLNESIDSAKDALSLYHLGMMRTGRILQWLDGRPDGPINRHIWQPMRAAVAKSALGRQFRMQEFESKIEGLNLNMRELYNKRIEVTDELTLTPNDLLEVYIATKDKEKLRQLKEGNNFTDTDVQAALKAIVQDNRLVQLGDWLLNKYGSDFDEVATKHKKTTGKELKRISGYSPIRRIRKGWARFKDADQEFNDILHGEILGEGHFRKKAVSKQFTEKRTGATGPLNLDALGNYVAHARAVEHYKAMALPVFNINRLINNNNFRHVVDKRTRGAGNKILSKWLQDVASERTSLENTMLSHTIGVLRRNAVVAALGFNIVSALKQPVSLSLALAENPKMIPLWTKAMAEGARSPKALKDFVHKRSTVVRHRNMERELREMSQRRSVRKQISGRRAMSEKAMVLIRTLDQATVHTVWKAAYDMALESTVDEQQAINYADSVVERTQPMADIMDLPHFFRGGELHKMFTLFQNQINQNYNYWAHDVIGATKRGEISRQMLAYRVIMSTILPATVLGLVSRGFTPGNPKEWAKDLSSFMLAPLFIAGKIISSIIQGYDPSSVVGMGFAAEAYEAHRAKEPEAKIMHLLAGTSKAAGIPWSQPKRTIKGIVELNHHAANDPRRLIWSQQALDKGKP